MSYHDYEPEPLFEGKYWGIYHDRETMGIGIAITANPAGLQLVFFHYIFQLYSKGK